MTIDFTFSHTTENYHVWEFKIWGKSQTLYIPKYIVNSTNSFSGIISTPAGSDIVLELERTKVRELQETNLRLQTTIESIKILLKQK